MEANINTKMLLQKSEKPLKETAYIEKRNLMEHENCNLYKTIVNNVKEIIFETDSQGLWTFLNRAWEEITGFVVEESLGQLFLNYIYPDDKEFNTKKFLNLVEKKKDSCRYEIRCITKDGGYRWVEAFARLIIDDNGNISGACGTINDITERKKMEIELKKHKNHLEELVNERTKELNEINEKLRNEIIIRRASEDKLKVLATYDSLTNVPNRYSLEKTLDLSIEKARIENIPSALLFIDLDNFKIVNDNFGHAIGDKILILLANKLKKHLKPKHFMARLGGDEFAILLDNTTIDEAKKEAEFFRKTLDFEDVITENGIEFNITASFGVVPITSKMNSQEVLSYADAALYVAKDNGKNRIEVIESFDEKTSLSEINRMVNLIKSSIRENRFILHYQPIYNITTKKIMHYEALIRMLDDENNIVSPYEFINIAERFGLMSQIDRWVVENTVKMLEKDLSMKIFINISGISLGDKALLKFIEETIKNSNIEPAHIGFEITETTAIKDLKQSELWIKELKKLGCDFALDDFGVGFSSFSYLSLLPIDYLKIDGAFIKDLDKNPTQKALVQAMNAVAHALNKKTIAEFVENEEILNILEELNIDYGQGYYLGKPEPIN